MACKIHLDIERKITLYPDHILDVFLQVRNLIFTVAEETNSAIEEITKWGEPSYVTKHGSTIHIDWKMTTPEYFCLFFNCKTVLFSTIKDLYDETFFIKAIER